MLHYLNYKTSDNNKELLFDMIYIQKSIRAYTWTIAKTQNVSKLGKIWAVIIYTLCDSMVSSPFIQIKMLW